MSWILSRMARAIYLLYLSYFNGVRPCYNALHRTYSVGDYILVYHDPDIKIIPRYMYIQTLSFIFYDLHPMFLKYVSCFIRRATIQASFYDSSFNLFSQESYTWSFHQLRILSWCLTRHLSITFMSDSIFHLFSFILYYLSFKSLSLDDNFSIISLFLYQETTLYIVWYGISSV